MSLSDKIRKVVGGMQGIGLNQRNTYYACIWMMIGTFILILNSMRDSIKEAKRR